MHPAIHHVEEKLDLLVAALDGQDADAIISASENLGESVLALAKVDFPSGSESIAQILVSKTISQLEAAAMRVNILKNWTRQRIDRNNEIRGIRQGGMQLNY